MNKDRGISILYLLGFMGIILSFFWEALTQSKLMVERDLPIFFFPNLKLWVEAIQAGELPLWNPYSFSGQPLFASLQTSILYLPNILLFLFPIDFAFNLTIVLHFFLSGWFVYLLCRELGGSRTAGILACLSFTLGGFLISVHNVLNTLQSVTWAPLILFFYIRALRQSSRRYIFLTALGILLQFLGGGIEAFLLTQALIIFLTLFPQALIEKKSSALPDAFHSLLEGKEKGFASWRWRFQMVALIYFLFLGLGAVQIIPFAEMAGNSDRYLGISYEWATCWSLNWKDMLYVFFPDFFWRGTGYYETDQNYLKSIYLGLIPLLLMIFFFLFSKGRKKIWFLLLLIVPLIFALGKNTPFYRLLYTFLPGASALRYPVKFFFFTNLWVCILAGLGWDFLSKRLKSNPGEKLSVLKAVSLFLALFSVIILLAFSLFRGPIIAFLTQFFPMSYARPWDLNIHNMERFCFFSLMTFLFFIFLADRKISYPRGQIILIILLTLDLFLANWGFYCRVDRKAFYSLSPNLQVVLSDPEKGRIYSDPAMLKAEDPRKTTMEEEVRAIIKEGYYSDFPLIHRIYNSLGFKVLTYQPYQDLLNILTGKASHPKATDILSLMNVRFILWREAIQDPALKLIRKGESYVLPEELPETAALRSPQYKPITTHLYENKEVLPKAFLVSEYAVVKNGKERMDVIIKKGFDPARVILLEEEPESPRPVRGSVPDQDVVRIIKHALNRVDLEASCTGPRLLFLSETYYPGWKVWIDGKRKKIYRANHAFRAVALDPGRHTINFIYRPFSFYFGLIISCLTCILMIVSLFILKKKSV